MMNTNGSGDSGGDDDDDEEEDEDNHVAMIYIQQLPMLT
jgi:hypothetical protein